MTVSGSGAGASRPAGFQIDTNTNNLKKCADIDECGTWNLNLCAQECQNFNGTHGCKCLNGFKLTDEYSGVCKANDDGFGIKDVSFSSFGSIRSHEQGQINRMSDVLINEGRIEDIDYDARLNMICWVDSSKKQIKRSYIPKMDNGADIGFRQNIEMGLSPKIERAWMDGSKRRVLASDALDTPTGLTIDFQMYHTLYWVDSKLNRISVMAKDGTRRNHRGPGPLPLQAAGHRRVRVEHVLGGWR